MIALPKVPAWVDRAACTEDDAPAFYPDRAGPPPSEALALCARCPVRLECLAYGLADDYGIYGGLTADERRALTGRPTRRARRAG